VGSSHALPALLERQAHPAGIPGFVGGGHAVGYDGWCARARAGRGVGIPRSPWRDFLAAWTHASR
jgi:hypothetical protein